MCAAEAEVQPRARLDFGTVVVIGGGCYGSYYVRQLSRARAAGAIAWERLVVVDRDAGCRVAVERQGAAELVIADWEAFFARYLGDAAEDPGRHLRDAIVPSPLMPHLLFHWVLARARARWPDREVHLLPLERATGLPWEHTYPDGTQVASFATWTCPINCIEPARCPATRGARDWSQPASVAAYAREEAAAGRPFAGAFAFHCSHRTYGVGMIDTREVLAADALVARAGEAGRADFLVATVSHCHGVWNRFAVEERAGSIAPGV